MFGTACTIPESSLERIAYTSPTHFVASDEKSRVGKPGAWRNREMRCEHGFVDGKACQVCNQQAREKMLEAWVDRRHYGHPLKVAKRERNRVNALMVIASGQTKRHELAHALGVSAQSASQQLRRLRLDGLIDGTNTITPAGLEFLKKKEGHDARDSTTQTDSD